MKQIRCKIKSYIQPFERQLALNELSALGGSEPIPLDGEMDVATWFQVTSGVKSSKLAQDLAYWERVGCSEERVTTQIRGEATSIVARNGILLKDLPEQIEDAIAVKIPNKRCLRYASHGIHEYRGKFFPQLVRALINEAEVPGKGIVADPMCGSGTTLVETVLAGRLAVGLDMNPLSVFVADVKCRVLALQPETLIRAYDSLERALSRPRARTTIPPFKSADSIYLDRWFDAEALDELSTISSSIEGLEGVALKEFYRVCLSNILRAVSWQKDEDLRVRREEGLYEKGDAIARFLAEANRSTKTVVAYLCCQGSRALGRHRIELGDARQSSRITAKLSGKVDAIITSPPYATALPYLDTDRLSLIYLGLLPRSSHRAQDARMIGNREITERERAAHWERFQLRKKELPDVVVALIEKVDRLNSQSNAGFRRRNLSSLLANYFFDMTEVLREHARMLAPRGRAFLVVGNNRTNAGGEDILIETAKLLAMIAETVGLKVDGLQSMEMLVSRDIFSKNATPSEYIIRLTKGSAGGV